MTNILHKRSSTPGAIPGSGDLTTGEIALNTADGTWFTKKTDNSVVDLRKPDILDGGEIILPPITTNLSLWLDASDSSTIVQSNGIITWLDKSGNKYHFTQTTDNSKPLYALRYQNGLNAIIFNGSTMSLVNSVLPASTTHTVLVALKPFSFAFGSSPYSINVVAGMIYNGSGFFYYADNLGAFRSGGTVGTYAHVEGYINNNLSVSLIRNNVVLAPFTSNSAINTSVGATIGRRPTAEYFIGAIFEILRYTSVLSAGDILNIYDNYLKPKWDLP